MKKTKEIADYLLIAKALYDAFGGCCEVVDGQYVNIDPKKIVDALSMQMVIKVDGNNNS